MTELSAFHFDSLIRELEALSAGTIARPENLCRFSPTFLYGDRLMGRDLQVSTRTSFPDREEYELATRTTTA